GALRNLSAEPGYQARTLTSGVVPLLMAVLTPVPVPMSREEMGAEPPTWTPFPLPCIADAIHVIANLSTDVSCRHALLQSGILPALLPVASDSPSSVLMYALATNSAQVKADFIRRREEQVRRNEEAKRNAAIAAALNARAAGLMPEPTAAQ